MDFQKAIQKYLPSILQTIHSQILNDPSVYEFVKKEELENLLKKQEELINTYLLSFDKNKIDETTCLQFYKDLKIPYAVIIKSLNGLKVALLQKLSSSMEKKDLLDFTLYFQHFIDIVAKVYLKKEAMEYKSKSLNDYYLLKAHQEYITHIIQAIKTDNMDIFPLQDSSHCSFSHYMEYLESMMVCMDASLCSYLHDLHKMVHSLANAFYRFYQRGSFNEAYLAFKDFKEMVLKFENVIKELYFVTFSDLEGSFFRFIQTYHPSQPQYLTLIDLKNLKNLNQIYGESTITQALHIIEKRLKEFLKDKTKHLLIRGITTDFYLYSLGFEHRKYNELVQTIKQLICKPIKIEGKNIEFDAFIVGLEIDEYLELKPQEIIKILHHLKKEAKTKGIDLYLILEPPHKEWIKKVLQDRYDLEFIKTALDTKRVELLFQPIIKADTKELFALEALARLKDGTTLIPAGLFIDKVYEANLIDRFDLAVLEILLEKKEQLQQATPRVFVNISAISLSSPAIIQFLDTLLHQLQIEVILEVTEQAMLQNKELLHTIHKKHNIYFAADDFGTGYTSIKSITDMAKDGLLKVLKIDGSLVKNIDKDPYDLKIIHVIAHLAREFDLYSVAEFVENEKVLTLLNESHIQLAQGYHIAKPMLLEEAILWSKEH